MTDLTGKVALVTGSARGIGRAIAERYASLGADIVINYSEDETSADARHSACWLDVLGGPPRESVNPACTMTSRRERASLSSYFPLDPDFSLR